jgi:hypothetical protein
VPLGADSKDSKPKLRKYTFQCSSCRRFAGWESPSGSSP